MAKSVTQFICRACGAAQSRWMGKCPECGTWDALEEMIVAGGSSANNDPQRGAAGVLVESASTRAVPIGEIDADRDAAGRSRFATGIGEFDRVLGGGAEKTTGKQSNADIGFVPGSAVLIGGDPGIGKSTILLQAAGELGRKGKRVLYVSSEESAQQLRLRAARLGVLEGENDELFVLADTNLARIVEQITRTEADLVVIDSIQMIYKSDLPSAPGSVSQLRTCCLELVYLAKATGCAIVFVGHVTKQGELAGPRLLEHMVDTVLYFEGDRYHSHRIIRGIKNRFGTTAEVGIFEMTGEGLQEVKDGAGVLAAEYQPRAGSVVCPVLQGSRCLLVEVQALTATGFLGSAKRKATGLDANRLAMLIAVLEKHGELRLADQDIFVSSVGGMKIVEPAADLAIALAIAGTHFNRQLADRICAIGEIGLGGEIRHVQQMPLRVAEAARLGFKHILTAPTQIKPPDGCQLLTAKSVNEALGHLN